MPFNAFFSTMPPKSTPHGPTTKTVQHFCSKPSVAGSAALASAVCLLLFLASIPKHPASKSTTKRRRHSANFFSVSRSIGFGSFSRAFVRHRRTVGQRRFCTVVGCVGKHENVAVALIQMGADVNQTDGFGDTPLHDAARKGLEKVVEELLKRGVSVTIRNNRGDTPQSLAAQCGNANIRRMIDNAVQPDSGQAGSSNWQVQIDGGKWVDLPATVSVALERRDPSKTIQYTIGQWKYEIVWKSGVPSQKNTKTNVERPLRRLQSLNSSAPSDPNAFPDYWHTYNPNLDGSTPLKFVQVDHSIAQVKPILQAFAKLSKSIHITKIELIINPMHWSLFAARRRVMDQFNKRFGANEKMVVARNQTRHCQGQSGC
eukprot:GABV01008591.1.p1 GENE.GABV01008591.1~~GABV01008591.1.p1  ORF type:complete len:372 (+),score=102.84 GABV01008591.1:168-1283(+)